ncbi:glycosyltransferase family 2 protein [Roseovarius phycicola]|uniref:Glycosyltransferase family 2 protein n=1 Tax=Roseovarius phycicola TaxID=3080976 RepID=A0ABZ2HJ36_9RHOB
MTHDRISIVTVSFNSSDVLENMLASCPEKVPVIVVDNGSSDIAATRLVARNHGAQLIENAENLGFGRACNRGAEEVQTPFVLFLNPDAALEEGTMDALIETAETHPDAVAINPVLIGRDGQPAIKRKSDLIPKSEYISGDIPDQDKDIYTLNGAAVMIRIDAFREVKGFDPNIFLFFEDDDLGARLRLAGGRLMVSHAARVNHVGGAASSGPRLAGEAFKAWHTGYSRLYTMRKHKLPFAVLRALARAIMRAASPTVVFSPLHRARRFAYLRGTWAALIDELSNIARGPNG